MTEKEFEELIKTAKPIGIEDTQYVRYGFVIVFDNGKKIKLSTETEWEVPFLEFEEL